MRQQPVAAWKVWLVKACVDAALFVRWKPAVPLSVGALLASASAVLMVVPTTALMAVSDSIAAVLTMTAAARMIGAALMIAAVLMAADSVMANSGFQKRYWLHLHQKMLKNAAGHGAHHRTPTLAMALLQ